MTVLSEKVVQVRNPRQCWGCLETFPSGSILLSSFCVENRISTNSYLCQDCYAETEDWDRDNFDCATPGGIGYWKDGIYHPLCD